MENFDIREWKKKQLLKESIQEAESQAAAQAKKKGLTYASFGRWADKSGKVVAKTENGRLVPVKGGEQKAPAKKFTKVVNKSAQPKQPIAKPSVDPHKEKLNLVKAYFDANSAADYYMNAGSRKGVNPSPYEKAADKAYAALVSKYGEKFANSVKKASEDEYEKMTYGRGPGGRAFFKKHGISPDDLELD